MGKSIGTRINEFDNGINNTVKKFNDIFTEIALAGFNENAIVSIGDLTVNSYTRELTVTSQCYTRTFNHEFKPLLKSEKEENETTTSIDTDLDF